MHAASAPSHESDAVPLTVKLPCSTVTALIRQHGRDFTRGGVFLAAPRALHPEGTRVRFAVELSNGQRVLEGLGVVRWSRGPAGAGERPRLPGMGVQFTRLEGESRKLVDLLVASQGSAARSDEPPGPEVCEAAFEEPLGAPTRAPSAPVAAPATPSAFAPPRIAPLSEHTPTPTPTPRSAGGGAARPRATPPGLTPSTRGLGEPPLTPRPSRAGPALDVPMGLTPRPSRVEPPALEPIPLPGPTPRRAGLALDLEPISLPGPTPPVVPAVTPASDATPARATPRPAPTRAEAPAVPAGFSIDDLDLSLEPEAPAVPAAKPAPQPEPLRLSLDDLEDLEDAKPSPAPAPKPVAAQAPRTPVVPAAPALTPPQAAAPGAPNGGSRETSVAAARAVEALRVSRAIDLLRKKEYARAEAELQLAVAQEPENARLRFELGLVYFEWSDADRDHDGAAEACFARAAELDPTFDQPLVYLGNVQLRRRLLKDAERSFHEALLRDPHGRGAQQGLALVRTLRWRRRAPFLAATAVAVLALAGLGYRLVVKGAPAAEPAQQVAQTSPTPAEAAPAPVAKVEPAPVAPAPQQAAAPGPEATPPATTPSAPAPSTEATPVAVAANAAPAASEPAPTAAAPSAPVAKAPAVRRSRPAATSRPAVEKPVAEKSAGGGGKGSAGTWVKKGEAALRSGQVEEAQEAFTRAIAADAGHAVAHRGLGSVLLMQGREAEAGKAFRQYLKLAPGAADAARIQALVQGL